MSLASPCLGRSTALLFQLLEEGLGRKMAPGTASVNRVDLLMGFHGRGAETTAGEKIFHQRMEAFDLLLRRLILVEVPHQADTDRLPVQGLAGQVTAVELGGPAMADGDLAVVQRVA